jgi:TetR/AcrR family transcriptional regulator, transcriptional repressor for nem operon
MSRTEQKAQTRQRIVESAGRGFRRSGYGGIGVDGLAREAGVTSGAFYVHFTSKSDAFGEAVNHGMADLRAGVLHFQQAHGRDWWPAFVRFYLGTKRRCDLSESCSLQSLSPEVARSDDAARAAFEAGLRAVAGTLVAGPRSAGMPRDVDGACAALAALVGAVTLARAVGTGPMADQIAAATGRTLLGARWEPDAA